MRVAVQTDNPRLFREAVGSRCSSVRFGSEFCEHLLPTKARLQRMYEVSHEAGKDFVYVTPRLSNAGIESLREQLAALDEMAKQADHSVSSVVVNDFGALNILHRYPNLRPQLGRNLLLVPARSAWAERHVESEGPSTELGGWLQALYSSTSLNYQVTIDLYRGYGCEGVDVDWVPTILPSHRALAECGLSLSVHLYLIPVTFTRKCHMARYLGEQSPETCSMPCLRRAFVLRNEALKDYGLDFFLAGNTVSPQDALHLMSAGVSDVVLTLNPITEIDASRKIDDLITHLLSSI
jgi:hypothetical protein